MTPWSRSDEGEDIAVRRSRAMMVVEEACRCQWRGVKKWAEDIGMNERPFAQAGLTWKRKIATLTVSLAELGGQGRR